MDNNMILKYSRMRKKKISPLSVLVCVQFFMVCFFALVWAHGRNQPQTRSVMTQFGLHRSFETFNFKLIRKYATSPLMYLFHLIDTTVEVVFIYCSPCAFTTPTACMGCRSHSTGPIIAHQIKEHLLSLVKSFQNFFFFLSTYD